MFIKMVSYSATMLLISFTFSMECLLGILLNNAVNAVVVEFMYRHFCCKQMYGKERSIKGIARFR